MNPYASHLEGRDPFGVIAETPGQLAHTVRSVEPDALDRSPAPGKWSVRLQVRPLVNYVWIAAFLMALGGGIAVSDRRYRTAKVPAAAEVAGEGALPGNAG